jgi:hypothetical protein
MTGSADILSVGMQYTARLERGGGDPSLLTGASEDVDALASEAGLPAHELPARLGST